MRFWTWLRERIGAEQAARRGRQKLRKLPSRPTPRFRPRLETLEDRCVPSTLAVTSPIDDVNVHGTLRYDIAHAQSGDTILLTGAAKSGIVLTHGELVLNQNVTIKSAGNRQIMISGGGQSRVFEVAAGTNVTLANLAISDGNGVADNPDGTSQYDNNGGGILNFGALTVRGSTLSGNHAAHGGGIFNFGTLTVSASTLSDNSASLGGGGIYNASGTLAVSASTLSGNSAAFDGGGIWNFGALAVSDSTLSGNSAGFQLGRGGGIANDGTATVSASTLSDNSATEEGGGIWNPGTLTVSASHPVRQPRPQRRRHLQRLRGDIDGQRQHPVRQLRRTTRRRHLEHRDSDGQRQHPVRQLRHLRGRLRPRRRHLQLRGVDSQRQHPVR